MAQGSGAACGLVQENGGVTLAEKLQYPPGEEDIDWAENTARIAAECRVVAENLRKSWNGSGDKEKPLQNEGLPSQNSGDSNDYHEEDTGEVSEVEGELPPLVDEGSRVMVCIEYKLIVTRHGPKVYLMWIDEDTGHLFQQYFRHYEKYPLGSKAVRNYIAAMDKRPNRLDRLSLRKLVGLRAEVHVETVKPEYSSGALKGQPMPLNLHYSKVAEIIGPKGRVDTNTLNQLRKRC